MEHIFFACGPDMSRALHSLGTTPSNWRKPDDPGSIEWRRKRTRSSPGGGEVIEGGHQTSAPSSPVTSLYPKYFRLPFSLLIHLQWYTSRLTQHAVELLMKHMLLLYCGLPAMSPSATAEGTSQVHTFTNTDAHWSLSLELSFGNHNQKCQGSTENIHNTNPIDKTTHVKSPGKRIYST